MRCDLAMLLVTCSVVSTLPCRRLTATFQELFALSSQLLTSLLAAPDPAVVTATLQTLVSFVRKTHASSVRWHGWVALNERLFALSQGWGGKEEVRQGHHPSTAAPLPASPSIPQLEAPIAL